MITLRACAKVNLGLRVLGRRPDGYHELRTILQTIDFHDELVFEEADSGIRLTTNLASIRDRAGEPPSFARRTVSPSFPITAAARLSISKSACLRERASGEEARMPRRRSSRSTGSGRRAPPRRTFIGSRHRSGWTFRSSSTEERPSPSPGVTRSTRSRVRTTCPSC